jgi:uncharacterized coiled-coil DUF342 family protein
MKRLSLINARIGSLLQTYDQANVRIRRLVEQQASINTSLGQLQQVLADLTATPGSTSSASGIISTVSEKLIDIKSAIALLKSILAQEKTLVSEIKKIGTSVKTVTPTVIMPTKGAN